MEARRLLGQRVLVTRPQERSRTLCFLLEDEGAEVAAVPLLELLPPADPRPLRAAAEQIERYAWVLLASPAAVEAVCAAAREAGTFARLQQASCGVVGPATARAAIGSGLRVVCVAERPTGEGLFEQVRASLKPDEWVLLPAAEDGRRELIDELEAAHLPVTRVDAYRSRPAEEVEADLRREIDRKPTAAIFGSPRTAEAAKTLLGEAAEAFFAHVPMVAMGPTTAAALKELGARTVVQAEQPTDEGLVDAVVVAVVR